MELEDLYFYNIVVPLIHSFGFPRSTAVQKSEMENSSTLQMDKFSIARRSEQRDEASCCPVSPFAQPGATPCSAYVCVHVLPALSYHIGYQIGRD